MGEVEIRSTEMHTCGEPLRIIESGYPDVPGETILERRRFVQENLDHLRQRLMLEPRGHREMFGALLLPPSPGSGADISVLFMHNQGYSTMCGHGVIAMGRYAVDRKYVTKTSPESLVLIECPCGVVATYVQYDKRLDKTGAVRFTSVPAFLAHRGVAVQVPGFGEIQVDISYGGAFYALVVDRALGLDLDQDTVDTVRNGAGRVTDAVRQQVKLTHPDSDDLAFLYGTIVTDGRDEYDELQGTKNVCVFADHQVDRSPCGSGVTARVAMQVAKGHVKLGETRTFISGVTNTEFKAKPIKREKCGSYEGVIIEVEGLSHYTGHASFTTEDNDELRNGFLVT